MRDWSPRTLWHDLCEIVEEWMSGEDADEVDPALLFHLALTVPLLIGLVAMLRRA